MPYAVAFLKAGNGAEACGFRSMYASDTGGKSVKNAIAVCLLEELFVIRSRRTRKIAPSTVGSASEEDACPALHEVHFISPCGVSD
jgi:hypothetical protein